MTLLARSLFSESQSQSFATAPTHDATACRGHQTARESPLHSSRLPGQELESCPNHLSQLLCPALYFFLFFLNCTVVVVHAALCRLVFWPGLTFGQPLSRVSHLGATVIDHDHPCSSTTRIFSRFEIPEPSRFTIFPQTSTHRLDFDGHSSQTIPNPRCHGDLVLQYHDNSSTHTGDCATACSSSGLPLIQLPTASAHLKHHLRPYCFTQADSRRSQRDDEPSAKERRPSSSDPSRYY